VAPEIPGEVCTALLAIPDRESRTSTTTA
jgi:hypothetical protein